MRKFLPFVESGGLITTLVTLAVQGPMWLAWVGVGIFGLGGLFWVFER